MKRDTRSAYRARAAATERSIDHAVAETKAAKPRRAAVPAPAVTQGRGQCTETNHAGTTGKREESADYVTLTRNPARTENPTPHMSAGKLYTAQRYLVGWPDGIVKVGSTMIGRARWGAFLNRGATMLDLAQYQNLCDDLVAETWLQEQIVGLGYRQAFEYKDDATEYLGARARGYLECYRIPVEDWPKIIEIARTEDALV